MKSILIVLTILVLTSCSSIIHVPKEITPGLRSMMNDDVMNGVGRR